MICQKCGNQNIEGSTFCVKCGANLKQLNNVNSDNISNNSINNVVQEQNNFINPVNEAQVGTTYQGTPLSQEYTQPVQQPLYNNSNNVINDYNSGTKKSNKLIPIIVIIVLLSALGFGAYKLFFSKEKPNVEEFNEVALIPVKEEDHYIYIDLNGNNAFEGKTFDEASYFHDGYAMIKEHYARKIINENAEVVLEEDDYSINDDYISKHKVWIINGKMYSSDLKQLSSDDLNVRYYDTLFTYKSDDGKNVGLLNNKGKIIYSYELSDTDSDYLSTWLDKDINMDIFKNRYCVLSVSNKYNSEKKYSKETLINCDTGKVIYPISEDISMYPDKNNIFNVTEQGNSYKVFINNDKVIFKGESDKYSLYYRTTYIEIYDRDNRKYKYYDIKNDKFLDEMPKTPDIDLDKINKLSEFEETYKLTKYEEDGKYGLKKDDKVICDAKYDRIYGFSSPIYEYLKSKGKEYFFANKDNKVFMLDMKGKIIKEFNASYIDTYSESPFIAYIDTDSRNKVVYNVLTGKSVAIDYKYRYTYFFGNYFYTIENKEDSYYYYIYKYYNNDCKLIYTEVK